MKRNLREKELTGYKCQGFKVIRVSLQGRGTMHSEEFNCHCEVYDNVLCHEFTIITHDFYTR